MAFSVGSFFNPSAASIYNAPGSTESHVEQYYDNRGILAQGFVDDIKDTFGGCSFHCQAIKADAAQAKIDFANTSSIHDEMQVDSDRTQVEQSALLKKMMFPGAN